MEPTGEFQTAWRVESGAESLKWSRLAIKKTHRGSRGRGEKRSRPGGAVRGGVTCTRWGVVGVKRVSNGIMSHIVSDAKHIDRWEVSLSELVEQPCNGDDVQMCTRQGTSKRNSSRAFRGQVTCMMRRKAMGPGSLREGLQ